MKFFTCIIVALFISLGSIAGNKDQKKFTRQDRDERMVYVPKGTIKYHHPDTDLSNNSVVFSEISVNSFYISPYEVSNAEYLEYLHYLQRNDPTAHHAALPDTVIWGETIYEQYYLRHPAYAHYPVVGVSHAQAVKFCEWLTEAYHQSPDRKYKKVVFRLPTKKEWYYAAIMSHEIGKYEKGKDLHLLYYQGSEPVFPCKYSSLQDEKGNWNANFRPIDQGTVRTVKGTLTIDSVSTHEQFYLGYPDYSARVAEDLEDGIYFVAPVYSFGANAMGLYNMAGNVEEMVAEYGITKGGGWSDTGYSLRNEVEETYDSANETTSSRGFRIAMDVLEEW